MGIFRENALIENIQIFLLLIGAISFGWQAKKYAELRPILLLLGSGCLLAICRELDDLFGKVLPFIHWKFGFLFSVVAIIYVYFHRKITWYTFFSLVRFPMLVVLGVLVAILLPLSELVEKGWFAPLFETGMNVEIVYEEIIEVVCYLLIFISSLEIHFNKAKILDKLYKKFGKNIELKVLSEKKDKVVYDIYTKSGAYILIIIPHITATRFYKYMSSQGLQQQLFLDGADAAEVIDAYIDGDNLVSVHRKFLGSSDFVSEEEMLEVSGRVYGKMHRITMKPQYKKSFLLLKYPNIWVRAYMFVRYILNRRISQYLKYFRLKDLPWGICHRDNNGKNVLHDENGRMVLIDFDKHRYMPLVEGLIYFYHRHLKTKGLFHVFLDAYQKERPLTDAEKEYLKKKIPLQSV